MSFAQTVLLGALAGFTIYLGLPVGRLQLLSSRARVGLAMFAVGILAFIFVDVLEHANEIVEDALGSYKDGHSSFGHLLALVVLVPGACAAGSGGLGLLERRLRPTPKGIPPMAGGSEAAAVSPHDLARVQTEAD